MKGKNREETAGERRLKKRVKRERKKKRKKE